jgi:K+-sensing histidine kinase KdpD/DNA-binding response OmpR family regulator
MARILVVDDEPVVVRTLTTLLSSNGFETISAQSGEQALELLAREPCDLVFLDVVLPGLSGFETCVRIRERHGPTLPVVMISARPDREAVRAGYDAGADDFMAKPPDMLALILKVRVLLRLKGLNDELLLSREELKRRVADLALLHEIGRDWSLIAEPREFYRVVTQRLGGLIGAPICLIAHHDPATHTLRAALPVHGLPDEVASELRYTVTPEYRAQWNFRSGRPYVSNRAASDPRLVAEMVRAVGAESIVIVPMLAEGHVLGLLCAVNKPGGFSDADVQLMSIFAGPAATFIKSREIFEQEREHGTRLERLSQMARDMAAATGRGALLTLTVSRLHEDFECRHVAFYGVKDGRALEPEAQAGEPAPLAPPELLRWAIRALRPLGSEASDPTAEAAVPVRAGDALLGVLHLQRDPGRPFGDAEQNLLSTLGGQLAVTLQKAHSLAASQRLAQQMATLYDVGLETSALRDLRQLFAKGAEEAGRLIQADHTSVFRLQETDGTLQLFAGWASQPTRAPSTDAVFKLGEGVAGRVALDRKAAMLNEVEAAPGFVERANPVARLLCVPLTFYDQERESVRLFGVLNATRRPGGPPFTNDDIEYLTRFAGQLSIAVANSMLFQAERERSEQLALVNALLREIGGNLSKQRILETAARRIREAFEYALVKIAAPEKASGELVVAVAAARDGGAESWSGHRMAGSIAEQAFRERRTIQVADVAAAPDGVKPVLASTRSQLAVPIRSGDEVAAVLKIESEQPHAFSRSKVVTLETLAEGIGIILRNAELYQALEQTNAQLVELDRTKSELVNIVAHDFRAPLAGVLGYAELLEWKDDSTREERVEHARAIIQSATHMATMVDKTLKTTRLETGHFPFDYDVVDLASTARDVVARFPRDPRHALELRLSDEPEPLLAWADGERVAEVLENLLSNAVKYSPAGGSVSLEVFGFGENVMLRVRDQGIGIAATDMERLFRPFSRVRTRQTAEIEGTGLGLYICERMVKAHGGRLWAESQPGKGSTFAVSLPRHRARAQAHAQVLLVAASDEATRRELRRIASELGYVVSEAKDGLEAVESSQRLLPAAVIVDRVLPKLGAVEVAERLRDTPATANTPVFALAAERDLGESASLFRACVPKPLDRAVLLAALEAVGAAPSRGA